jgi:hypothetical protein
MSDVQKTAGRLRHRSNEEAIPLSCMCRATTERRSSVALPPLRLSTEALGRRTRCKHGDDQAFFLCIHCGSTKVEQLPSTELIPLRRCRVCNLIIPQKRRQALDETQLCVPCKRRQAGPEPRNCRQCNVVLRSENQSERCAACGTFPGDGPQGGLRRNL